MSYALVLAFDAKILQQLLTLIAFKFLKGAVDPYASQPERVRGMLAGTMPAGMEVLDVLYVDPKGPSLEEAFPYARWLCEFAAQGDAAKDGASGADAARLAEEVGGALDGLLEQGSMVVKRGKKEKTVVFEGLLAERPRVEPADGGRAAMELLTFTEGKGSLRPDLFCAELLKRCEGVRVAAITRLEQLPAE